LASSPWNGGVGLRASDTEGSYRARVLPSAPPPAPVSRPTLPRSGPPPPLPPPPSRSALVALPL
jgi:hypothetical protein